MVPLSQAAHAARRAARLKAVEAAKPEGERLLQREWDDHVTTIYSVWRSHALELVKNQVISTMCLDEVRICQTEEEAKRYFVPGGTPWTILVFKRFIEAYVLSAQGNIQTELSIYTIQAKVLSIFAAAALHRNPVNSRVKHSMIVWLHTNLKPRGLVHDNRLPKPTPMPSDITSLLRKYFQPEYLVAAVQTTRTVLNTALTLGLMLDCNSRISELIDAGEVPVNLRAAHQKEKHNKIFTWQRVELFVFRETEESQLRLQARLTFKNLKSGLLQPKRQKIIPLRLLPLDLAAEDTLRWLVILGLMDGVFQGIEKWDDFEALRYAPEGIKIRIKEEFLNTPVLRSYPWNANKYSTNLIQMTATHFRRELSLLSRYCGLEYKMLPGFLRRTSAYVLSLHASAEDRCARMGHSARDATYFQYYRNEISTIDFQAMRLGIPAEAVDRMSSITLNRLQQPPTTVSEAGKLAIAQDPELVSNLQRQHDLTDKIVMKYGSFDAVQPDDNHLLSELSQLKARYTAHEAYLMKKQFETEWKAHFDQRSEESAPNEVPDVSTDQTADVENLILVLEQQDEQLQKDLENIDPALLEDMEAENNEENILEDLGEELNLDGVQYQPSDAEDVENDNDTPNLKSRKSKYRFSLRPVGKYSLLHGVTDLLYNQAPDLTAARLSDAFVGMFNHGHVADRFYPNQEPLPGTMECRFCGDPLTKASESAKHAYHCEVAAIERQVFEKLQRYQATKSPVQKCTHERADKPGSYCSYDVLPAENSKLKAPAHFGLHAKRYHFDRTTSEFVCKAHTLSFSSPADYRLHMIEAHDIPLAVIRDGKKIIQGSLSFWCKICQVHVPRNESTEDDHFASHLPEVNEVMQPFGLIGFDFSHQWLHPSFCPFCIFDKNAPIGERMFFYQVKSRFMSHVESHLTKLKDDVQFACPAAMDSGDGVQAICDRTTAMSKEALREHFVKDHGMIFDFAKPKKTPSRAKGPRQKKDEKNADEDEEDTVEEGETDEEGEEDKVQVPLRKKAKISKATSTKSDRPLQKKDANRK